MIETSKSSTTSSTPSKACRQSLPVVENLPEVPIWRQLEKFIFFFTATSYSSSFKSCRACSLSIVRLAGEPKANRCCQAQTFLFPKEGGHSRNKTSSNRESPPPPPPPRARLAVRQGVVAWLHFLPRSRYLSVKNERARRGASIHLEKTDLAIIV